MYRNIIQRRLLSTTRVSFDAPKSSCIAGTPLPGLQILKDDPEKVAREDEAYPDWLWTILEPRDLSTQGDQTFNAAQERKNINKQHKIDIKAKNFLKST
ncbi:hypothetical protein E3Q22_01263 [Wallemia mellicola]|uniref:Large ribosomal subunit protein mL54 n=2 Tax=Wallemia mellicola TaxID=1708541 RepID=A0A4V4MVA9_9BASI|nr:hypothetical protein WALSEDRAFT_43481 [Wallemia mellicola CBS 633.66]TIB75336.1 hypothetical protein E3Q24_00220 [Wallemia mellicola]EIM23388.1 hypothetical protein WALSEDRAFT_43481 [Wallemia mellicola CBS 633.66]TIB78530.1 hypothetical protein E3Q23_00741 [Wallemia mellicola]TIB81219.1 hypothetical protein E3Q22_01263 [Wallemia mellicola]TIB89170.1 hypothetical protein E3Q21_00744 [Wallemia mellicola]|eukprot:XP_006956768.1 hypothetical protein WALSEDRAFT_43481 [Wallemia mellicola CBS 633.66]